MHEDVKVDVDFSAAHGDGNGDLKMGQSGSSLWQVRVVPLGRDGPNPQELEADGWTILFLHS